jgi:futalosine hydrolase
VTRLLVVTAVAAERDAVLAGLAPRSPGVEVIVAGVGPAAAAAGAARALALAEAAGRPYAAVVSAGVGGGIAGRTPVGGLALAERCVAGDLGAESPDGFLPLDRLGFGATAIAAGPDLFAALRAALPAASTGAIVTVCTVTGTAASAAALLARHPDAVAEGMEGFGVATAAAQAGVAVAELRAISNLVGPRDRTAWRLPDALAALTTAFASLPAGWLA